MSVSKSRLNPLKSTTSLTLCIALALPMPGPATAQARDRCEGQTIQLGERPDNRAELRCLRQLRREARDAGQPVPEPSAEEPAAEAEEAAADEAALKAQLEAQAKAEAEAQAAAEAEARAAAEAQAQAEADAAARAAADAEAARVQAEADAAARAAAEAEAAAQAAAEAEEARAQAEADAAAEAQAAAEAEAAAEAARLQAEAEAEADAQAQAQARAEAEAAAAAQAEEEARIARELRDRAARDAEEAAAEAAEQEAQEAREQARTRDERREQRRAERAAARDERRADREARAAGEASVDVSQEEQAEAEIDAAEDLNTLGDDTPAAAADNAAPVATVEVERVTEDTARSSTEDFLTSARGTEETREQRRAKRAGNDGLSDLEKVALFGLGALAVGAILNNGAEVKSNSGDRVVVERDGQLFVLKDDDTLLRRPGSDVRTERFNDGSTRTTVTRPDGDQIATIRAADGRVLRRTRITPDGQRILLIDDTVRAVPVRLEELPEPAPAPVSVSATDRRAMLDAMLEADSRRLERGYSLAQVRNIRAVRDLVAPIDLDAINFDTGSAAIRPSEARDLIALGELMLDLIDVDPGEIFLIEGHTDATGSAAFNLALSDRRAESVALALNEFFGVPPENMVIQGYGESNLKIPTLEAEPLNRRAVVRRITPLLQTADLR